MEEWRQHPRLTDIEVSSCGRIRRPSASGGYHFIKPRNNGRGYWNVNRKNRTFYVHRLVAETFLGIHDNLQVDHIDGDKQNNALNNLRFVDASTNIQAMYARGISRASHDKDTLDAIVFMRDCGMSLREIAEQIGTDHGAISNTLRSKTLNARRQKTPEDPATGH